jgi:hypothetical protein
VQYLLALRRPFRSWRQRNLASERTYPIPSVSPRKSEKPGRSEKAGRSSQVSARWRGFAMGPDENAYSCVSPQTHHARVHARKAHARSVSRQPSTAQDAVETSASRAGAVQRSGFPMPASAQRDPTRRPCRWRCAPQRQGGGIHRHAAGIHLKSRRAPLPTRPNESPFRSEFTEKLYQN